jgi:hypothetical protein
MVVIWIDNDFGDGDFSSDDDSNNVDVDNRDIDMDEYNGAHTNRNSMHTDMHYDGN